MNNKDDNSLSDSVFFELDRVLTEFCSEIDEEVFKNVAKELLKSIHNKLNETQLAYFEAIRNGQNLEDARRSIWSSFNNFRRTGDEDTYRLLLYYGWSSSADPIDGEFLVHFAIGAGVSIEAIDTALSEIIPYYVSQIHKRMF